MHTRRRHDARGRGLRGPLLPPETPRWRSRAEAFDQAVLDAYAPIEERWRANLTHLDIAVDTVPRMHLDPAALLPEEIASDGPVPLGRLIPAGVDERGRPTRPRIVIFRRPVELRALGPAETEELLARILVQLVAVHLNMPPGEIDPRWERWAD